jgi:Family of unknown function (DUF5343)
MAIENRLPYVTAYGNITKALDKIKTAATPDRFSQDFLEKTLGMTGGGNRPVLPFLKRTGFLNQDGTPTELYKEFRNPDRSGGAAAQALKVGYGPLYQMDEKVHTRDSGKLKNLVVQATGMDADSSSVRSIAKSFEALKAFAKFNASPAVDPGDETQDGGEEDEAQSNHGGGDGRAALNLGYTINLNLPATSDAGVYNAIFRSLRENLLRDLE